MMRSTAVAALESLDCSRFVLGDSVIRRDRVWSYFDAMTTDEVLANHVVEELAWDPKIDSDEIAVAADAGAVTLRGTVGSFRQKREAQRAAERVHGVRSVDNDLDVRILTGDRREDAHLRGDVLQALMLDTLVPSTIGASVADGFVTLTGTADWQYQRDEADFVAGNVPGVTGVGNEVYLTSPTPYSGDVKHSIRKAIERSARIDADNVGVETLGGTAILTGTVRSWAEHDSAVQAAWAAPGVTGVDDRLEIVY
jgi:osmotically-inducible protein OsmY